MNFFLFQTRSFREIRELCTNAKCATVIVLLGFIEQFYILPWPTVGAEASLDGVGGGGG